MRFPGRLSAAIEVLSDLESRHRPASEALRDWGLSHRFAGAGDRAAIGNLVYDGLRKRANHAFAMKSDAARALILSVAVRDWGEDPHALAATFDGDGHAPEAISADELTLLTSRDPLKDAPDSTVADIPDWLATEFERSFGADWVAEAAAFTARAPLDLRVNTLKSDRDAVLAALSRFDPKPISSNADGVRLKAGARDARTPNVKVDEGYLKGWFEIQDEGSQIVARLTGANSDTQVLDLCAGAGGKSLAMAAAMANKGQIYAFDVDRHRLAPIYERLSRSGVRNVQVRAPGEGALDDLMGQMGLVVVDAPCTGTGTWRRRPDAKWRLGPNQLATRLAEQAKVLEAAGQYVRPGGHIAYITCSVLGAENDDQIEAFGRSNPEFELVDPAKHWSTTFPEHSGQMPRLSDRGILLSPLATGTDGFYFSLLRRKAAA